jgi:hypothetical protein
MNEQHQTTFENLSKKQLISLTKSYYLEGKVLKDLVALKDERLEKFEAIFQGIIYYSYYSQFR